MDGREFLDVKYIFERANFSEKIRLEVRVSTFVFFSISTSLILSKPNLTDFWSIKSRARALQSFGLYVLEVENPRSEFWFKIKIIVSKSTSGNAKMAYY